MYPFPTPARFARDGGGADYRQRAQAETAGSMMKRNLGSELCCHTPAAGA